MDAEAGALFMHPKSPPDIGFSGSVAASGKMQGTLALNVMRPDDALVEGSGTFTGKLTADGGLTLNLSAQLNAGDTCALAGTLTGY